MRPGLACQIHRLMVDDLFQPQTTGLAETRQTSKWPTQWKASSSVSLYLFSVAVKDREANETDAGLLKVAFAEKLLPSRRSMHRQRRSLGMRDGTWPCNSRR